MANTREGNVGGHTLSQDLGPLHRIQRCGGVDRQCDLEVLRDSTQVVFKTTKVARHIGLVQSLVEISQNVTSQFTTTCDL